MRIFILLMAMMSVAFVQDSKRKNATIRQRSQLMVTDNIGNVYLCYNDQILKYDADGIFIKEFSNKNFGNIAHADATNALRILLFYKEVSRIIFLDNTLSINAEPVQLEALGFPNAQLACTSMENGLWLYDQDNFELIRLNRNLQIEQRTGNLGQVLNISIQPNFMVEKNNRLFVNNPSTGIMIFDIYGTYAKTIPIKNLTSFQVLEDRIIYFEEQKLKAVDLLSYMDIEYKDSEFKGALNVRLEKQKMVVHYADSCTIYKQQ